MLFAAMLLIYRDLLSGDTFGSEISGAHRMFPKKFIPLNSRSQLKNSDYSLNENGIPCCPHDEQLSMKYEGISKLRNGITRYKFVCPKIKWVTDKTTDKNHRECRCPSLYLFLMRENGLHLPKE